MTRARPVRRAASSVARAGNETSIVAAVPRARGARNGLPSGAGYTYRGGDLLPEPREVAAAVRERLAARDRTQARMLCELLCDSTPCRVDCPCPCHRKGDPS